MCPKKNATVPIKNRFVRKICTLFKSSSSCLFSLQVLFIPGVSVSCSRPFIFIYLHVSGTPATYFSFQCITRLKNVRLILKKKKNLILLCLFFYIFEMRYLIARSDLNVYSISGYIQHGSVFTFYSQIPNLAGSVQPPNRIH